MYLSAAARVWSQQAYIKASNTGGGDEFGRSVAISDNTLMVGAIGEDSNATGINGDQSDNLALDSGAVYVFTRSGTVWSQQAYVKASNTGGGDVFGFSVASFRQHPGGRCDRRGQQRHRRQWRSG